MQLFFCQEVQSPGIYCVQQALSLLTPPRPLFTRSASFKWGVARSKSSQRWGWNNLTAEKRQRRSRKFGKMSGKPR